MANFSVKEPIDLSWYPHKDKLYYMGEYSISDRVFKVTKPRLTSTVEFNKWDLWMLAQNGKLVPLISSKRLLISESILKELE